MREDQCKAERSAVAEPLWVKVRPVWVEKELTRRSCLDMLMSRFGLDAAMVSAPQLGKVLGMSRSTIYASVKAGTFFIPHRLIGASPVFTIDDVVTWYLDGGVQAQSKIDAPTAGFVASFTRNANDAVDALHAREKPARDMAVDAMVARAAKKIAEKSR